MHSHQARVALYCYRQKTSTYIRACNPDCILTIITLINVSFRYRVVSRKHYYTSALDNEWAINTKNSNGGSGYRGKPFRKVDESEVSTVHVGEFVVVGKSTYFSICSLKCLNFRIYDETG